MLVDQIQSFLFFMTEFGFELSDLVLELLFFWLSLLDLLFQIFQLCLFGLEGLTLSSKSVSDDFVLHMEAGQLEFKVLDFLFIVRVVNYDRRFLSFWLCFWFMIQLLSDSFPLLLVLLLQTLNSCQKLLILLFQLTDFGGQFFLHKINRLFSFLNFNRLFGHFTIHGIELCQEHSHLSLEIIRFSSGFVQVSFQLFNIFRKSTVFFQKFVSFWFKSFSFLLKFELLLFIKLDLLFLLLREFLWYLDFGLADLFVEVSNYLFFFPNVILEVFLVFNSSLQLSRDVLNLLV